jgi:hypothetical protein
MNPARGSMARRDGFAAGFAAFRSLRMEPASCRATRRGRTIRR